MVECDAAALTSGRGPPYRGSWRATSKNLVHGPNARGSAAVVMMCGVLVLRPFWCIPAPSSLLLRRAQCKAGAIDGTKRTTLAVMVVPVGRPLTGVPRPDLETACTGCITS